MEFGGRCKSDIVVKSGRKEMSLLVTPTTTLSLGNNCTYHPIFYLDALIKTGSESIEATIRRRQVLFARFVARIEDERLPKYMMFRELVGGTGCVGSQEKGVWGVSWTTSELLVSTPTSGRLQPRTRRNSARRRDKGRSVSWRNGLLQRKSGPDYGMQ